MRPYQVLREHGVRSVKQLGQHFLVDPVAVERVLDAADLHKEDTVLEIGPGPGILTVHLAQRAGRVIAVEVDERMLAPLHESLGGLDGLKDQRRVRVVHGDILKQDIPALVDKESYKVVANLPYYITSAVLRHILESAIRPKLIVVTVQREVAERIVGRSVKDKKRRGQEPVTRMSLLAVSVQFYGAPRIVARIPKGAFQPPPSVESTILRIDVYDPLPWPAVDVKSFFQVVRAGFAQPRKQLHNTLAHGLSLPAGGVAAALSQAGVDGQRRAETLSIPEWVTLTRTLNAIASLDSRDEHR